MIIIKLKQAVIVEGKYDKSRLANFIDAPIITSEGFGIMNDPEKTELIRFFAKTTGIIILTDSDRAGFKIRNYIKSAVRDGDITNVYIPDVFGKERRKISPGREGKIGVEGIPDSVIIDALKKAGVIPENDAAKEENNVGNALRERREKITKADLNALGLSGTDNAREKRLTLQKKIGLPENLSANGLLDVLNVMYTKDEIYKIDIENT